MIHRDVKPDNIILRPGEAKHADLGMVDMRGHAAARRTPERTTLWYPRRSHCRRRLVHHRIDLWSGVRFTRCSSASARETEIPMFL